MKKRFSVYHFLIVLILSTLIFPGFVSAGQKGGGNGNQGEEVTGSLTIHKFEQEPGGERGEGDGSIVEELEGKPLAGVEYTLTQTHSYNPATDEWTAISDGETLTEVTDADGEIVLDPIPLGRYTVQETDWPDHVVPDKEEYTVDIPMTSADGSAANYDVHIYPKNETIRGAVVLEKVDGETCPEIIPQSSPTGKKVEECEGLSGVVFDLYQGEELYQEGLETDEFGRIIVNGLEYGSYTFKEVSTIEGYVLGGDISFKIENPGQVSEDGVETSGEVVWLTAKNYQEPEVEKEVSEPAVNRGEVVTYTITVDLPADINTYESFVITDVLHENLEYVDGSAEVPAGFEFSKSDQTLTWTATDFSALKPGELAITFDAKISEDAEANVGIDNKATIDYENQHGSEGEKETDPTTVTPTVGSLKVIKLDGDKKKKNRLKGAEFELKNADGEVVASGTTNDRGFIVFDELDYGNYQLVETKAPEGFNLLRNPIDVTIDAENHDVTLEVENYKSDWELPKTGGIGTTLFTAIGTILMATSLYLFVRRRRILG